MSNDEAVRRADGGLRDLLAEVPDAFYRLDLESPIELSSTISDLRGALLNDTSLSYCNAAFAALHAVSGPLGGRPLRELAPASLLTTTRELASFQSEGRHEVRDVRIVVRDVPRFFRSIWIGELDGVRLTGIWGALVDETSAREVQQRSVAVPTSHEENLIGRNGGLRAVMDKVEQVAPTDATVLISGETGTGKELITRAIHAHSRRAGRPLIAVNCGAISPSLVESELFGHEKGAFTGAVGRKLGRFELADGGTLFLDEVGDLPADLQVKLLRVLQEGELTRVGGTDTVSVDVRVIAATHRNLSNAVQDGAFRQDLYYRLNVFPIRVPPLRDRKEDIEALVTHLVDRYAKPLRKRIETIPEELLAQLTTYPWPGNIRELANLIERSVIATNGPILELGDWTTGHYQPVPIPGASAGRSLSLTDVERDHIRGVLVSTGWRVSGDGGAAQVLGLKPTTLEARMKKLGIERPGRSR